MYENVPAYIRAALKGEPVDFIVQSSHDLTKRAIGFIILPFCFFFSWIFLFPIMFSIPFLEIMATGKTKIIINGTSQTFTKANLWGPIMFALFPIIFSLILIIPLLLVLYFAIRLILNKGLWYAGTNKHLIEFDGKKANYYPWNEFEEAIQTTHHKDSSMDIILRYKKSLNTLRENPMKNLQNFGTFEVTINGKPLDINNSQRWLFMNKIGLFHLKNGSLIFNMIRHNMERFHV